jgi:uncharacterized membrane protein YfcA
MLFSGRKRQIRDSTASLIGLALMPLPELFAFVLAIVVFGGIAGLIAGMFGIGGGVITVPLLYTIFKSSGVSSDLAIHTAIGTSLLTIIPTSIASLRAHAKHNAVDIAVIKAWAPAIILGAILGGMIANHLSGQALSLIFGFFTAAIAAFMGLTPSNLHAGKKPPKGFAQKSMAFLIGLISAMVGIGGGSLTVPTLVMYRTPIHRAIGTASAIGILISLPASAVFMLSHTSYGANLATAGGGFVPFGNFGNVNILAFALLAPVTMLMAPKGARLAHRLHATHLQRIFAFFLALIAVRMIVAAWT